MRVRDWDDIVEDVTESSADAGEWRAAAGDRRGGLGEDLYLGHPSQGVYLLKTYAKNPRDLRGVGTQVARKVDDGLEPMLPTGDDPRRFAVQSPPEDEEEAKTMAERLKTTVESHADAPEGPDAFFEDMMDALDSPAFGPLAYDFDDRPDELDELSEEFADAEALLNEELDDLIDDDDVGRGFA
ncbi:MAG: hypothetical protein ABEJ79_01945 [Halolamina sp.]